LWQNANQKRCDALRGAGRVEEALESFRYMMNMIDENAKARCFGWSNGKSGVHIVTQALIPTRFTQHLSRNTAPSILLTEMLPSLQTITTGLLTYTL
jgi:cytochrome b